MVRKATLFLMAAVFLVATVLPIASVKAEAPKINVQMQPKKAAENKAEKAPASGKQPAISFDSNQFDAGEVWEGDIVTHSFTVKNTGKAELTISNVKPG